VAADPLGRSRRSISLMPLRVRVAFAVEALAARLDEAEVVLEKPVHVGCSPRSFRGSEKIVVTGRDLPGRATRKSHITSGPRQIGGGEPRFSGVNDL